MINKHFTYNWLLFPILAVLFAGSMVGCGNDPVMEEDTTSGKTTLSITVRGITITEPTDDNYDDYVGTLRVIGYDDAGNAVCNELYDMGGDKIEPVKTGEEIVGYKIKGLELSGSFSGGTCHFYFIANEESYSIYEESGNTNPIKLTEFLNNDVEEQDLSDCIISAIEKNLTPILMTTQIAAFIRQGSENVINDVELIRCVAKVQLMIVNETNETAVEVVTPTLSGTYPDSYSLWEGSSYTGWSATSDGIYSVPLEDLKQDGKLFVSKTVYFPERLLVDRNTISMKFSFTLKIDNQDYFYTVAIGNSMDDNTVDYNIRRNTYYTVIAKLNSVPDGHRVTFNALVVPWTTKEIDIPAFE